MPRSGIWNTPDCSRCEPWARGPARLKTCRSWGRHDRDLAPALDAPDQSSAPYLRRVQPRRSQGVVGVAQQPLEAVGAE
jgi:hypothetical protein